MAFQGEQVFFGNQNYQEANNETSVYSEIERRFHDFLKNWTNESNFVYRDQLMKNGRIGNYFVKVNLNDIESYDIKMAMELRERPFSHLASVEKAARDYFIELEVGQQYVEVPSFQVQFYSGEEAKKLRQIGSDNINQIINIQGTVISAGRVLLKGKTVILRCKKCQHEKVINQGYGLNSLSIPSFCERNNKARQNEGCSKDSYEIQVDLCQYTDIQILKIQESTESMPVGEIPRTFQIHCENYLVDQMIPGNKISLTGIYTIMEKKLITSTSNANTLKIPFIYVLGFENYHGSGRVFNQNFSAIEISHFQEMAKEKDVFEKISKCIAPSIYGHDDIKKAITCQLFGGSSKVLPDKTRLRGDINILLMGDPSTAKSQLLKFVQKIFPVCIYTSGKGSSAAGLTAAIIKDNSTKEFHLEGGALVLADGGIVCIDEFDKMRTQDRVAIHEAMEQQTISIAKAGITTVLNSRTAILAAANPIFGSFNDLKAIDDQIDLQTTILSRFDCIFIVRDMKSSETDLKIAKHVLGLHTINQEASNPTAENDLNWIKKYITYARTKIFPRLSDEASSALENFYVENRSLTKDKNAKHSRIPITVRQLEAIIRLSEAVAKTRLSSVVTMDDTLIAKEIFEKSTKNAIDCHAVIGESGSEEFKKGIIEIEDHIKAVVKMSTRITYEDLKSDLKSKFDNDKAIERAIINLRRDGTLEETNQRNSLMRKK